MNFHHTAAAAFFLTLAICVAALRSVAQQSSGDSSSSRHARTSVSPAAPALDLGSIANGTYHNKSLAFACKLPPGWVLRTDELNAREEYGPQSTSTKQAPDPSQRVLLAAFSRPPEARGEDINSSILIAIESASSYPGLKDAVQYFGPVAEVAKAQGFTMNDEPYEIEIGSKVLARADFQKDVGSRVMRQSTLVLLVKSYVLSFTFIGGTEDEVEELIDNLSFAGAAKPPNPR